MGLTPVSLRTLKGFGSRKWFPIAGGEVNSKANFLTHPTNGTVYVVPDRLSMLFIEHRHSFLLRTSTHLNSRAEREVRFELSYVEPDGSLTHVQTPHRDCDVVYRALLTSLINDKVIDNEATKTSSGHLLYEPKVRSAFRCLLEKATLTSIPPLIFNFLDELNSFLCPGHQEHTSTTDQGSAKRIRFQNEGSDAASLRLTRDESLIWRALLTTYILDFVDLHKSWKDLPPFFNTAQDLALTKNSEVLVKMNFGMLLFAKEKYLEALEQFIRADQAGGQSLDHSFLSSLILQWTAKVYSKLKRFDLAEPLIRTALDYFTRTAQSGDEAAALMDLGSLFKDQKQNEKAIDSFRQAINVYTASKGNPFILAEAHHALASLLLLHDNAIELSIRHFEMCASCALLVLPCPTLALAYQGLGICEARLGNRIEVLSVERSKHFANSERWILQALDLVATDLGNDDVQVADLQFLLANVVRLGYRLEVEVAPPFQDFPFELQAREQKALYFENEARRKWAKLGQQVEEDHACRFCPMILQGTTQDLDSVLCHQVEAMFDNVDDTLLPPAFDHREDSTWYNFSTSSG